MLPLDIYHEFLEVIEGVKFTPREIDIIACILNGRSAKTIPSLLLISPKTVSAHIENIRAKIGCSSRESIIDFMEHSDKHSLIKNEYYVSLLTQNSFEKYLKEISAVIPDDESIVFLMSKQEEILKSILVQKIKQHLKIAGFKVEIKTEKESTSLGKLVSKPNSVHKKYILYITSEPLFKNNVIKESSFLRQSISLSDKVIFLSFNTKEEGANLETSEDYQLINFDKNDYYSSFLKIFKMMPINKKVDDIISNFKQEASLRQHTHISPSLSVEHTLSVKEKVNSLNIIYSYVLSCFSNKKIIYLLGGITILLIIFFGAIAFKKIHFPIKEKIENNTEGYSARSDLALPAKSIFLSRPELIADIDNKFKGEKGIQTVALVGIGGAGKTTLARQYAQQQKADIIWEIHAETIANLNASFEKLAVALLKTDGDKKELREIQEIKTLQEREEKLIKFVKTRLKATSNWFLIFDNVDEFTHIQNYFPQDFHTWGTGKIILTTRDYNLQNHHLINHVLFIGEIDKKQKLNLFTQILNRSPKNLTVVQQKETEQFLTHIPSFPLDVSLAAYYLKVTNISYAEYLENLNNYRNDFDNIQSNILHEVGSYNKTRYGIISLSLKKVMAVSNEFTDLFFFISLLNSQNIPRDLLAKYKNNIVVDNFIYYLKKYSLIIDSPISQPSTFPTLSIHHSTQNISLAYLMQKISLRERTLLISKIVNALDDYVSEVIEHEDFPKMQIMARHLEAFLSHPNLLPDFSRALLESDLGCIYYFINDDRYHQLLKKNFALLKSKNIEHLSEKDISRLARSLLQIGIIYTESKFDTEAETFFKQAVALYQKGGAKSQGDLSWALAHLGNIYRRLGDYEKAKAYFEKSLQLHSQYGVDSRRVARILAYLGFVDRKLGSYKEAIKNLEESLVLYNAHLSHDHFRIGWILIQLGETYSDLGEDSKAESYLKKAISLFKKHIPENHLNKGLALAYSGNYYRKLGEYETSRSYLEESLKIYQKYSDETYLRMGWVLFNLANTYKALGKDQEAQELFSKVLKIYSSHCIEDNIRTARLLRDMAGIYLSRNQLETAEECIKRSLKILQIHNHIRVYRSLEILGDIYLEKSRQAFQAKNSSEAQRLKEEAIHCYTQAITIINQRFENPAPHSIKIQSKINAI